MPSSDTEWWICWHYSLKYLTKSAYSYLALIHMYYDSNVKKTGSLVKNDLDFNRNNFLYQIWYQHQRRSRFVWLINRVHHLILGLLFVLAGLESLPGELQRNFNLMRDLDQRAQGSCSYWSLSNYYCNPSFSMIMKINPSNTCVYSGYGWFWTVLNSMHSI